MYGFFAYAEHAGKCAYANMLVSHECVVVRSKDLDECVVIFGDRRKRGLKRENDGF